MTHTDKMLRDGSLAGKVIRSNRWRKWPWKSDDFIFLELGAKVAITSRKIEKLEATAKELSESTGGECLQLHVM